MPPSAWESMAKDLLSHLEVAQNNLDELSKTVRTELAENRSVRAVLQERVNRLDATISSLDTVLRGGNGSQAMTTRVNALEFEVKQLRKDVSRSRPANHPIWLQIVIQSSPVWLAMLFGCIAWFLYFMIRAGWDPL